MQPGEWSDERSLDNKLNNDQDIQVVGVVFGSAPDISIQDSGLRTLIKASTTPRLSITIHPQSPTRSIRMKLCTQAITALLFAAAAHALSPKVTYDGTKVLRINTTESTQAAESLKEIISNLQLPLWTQNVGPNTHVDFEVSEVKLAAFEEAIAGQFTYSIMHEDLGASIREEAGGTFCAADCMYYFFHAISKGIWGCGVIFANTYLIV